MMITLESQKGDKKLPAPQYVLASPKKALIVAQVWGNKASATSVITFLQKKLLAHLQELDLESQLAESGTSNNQANQGAEMALTKTLEEANAMLCEINKNKLDAFLEVLIFVRKQQTIHIACSGHFCILARGQRGYYTLFDNHNAQLANTAGNLLPVYFLSDQIQIKEKIKTLCAPINSSDYIVTKSNGLIYSTDFLNLDNLKQEVTIRGQKPFEENEILGSSYPSQANWLLKVHL